ncbi:MFS transporter [Nocardioides sp.]|uniref:MFS transporter n=1 Tax=Nocardioides sp. TaxID=35761 RepID=UPI002BF1408A|nr:MFS transporter [Nocardioides sp.]HSX66723.1 MFS transporter [Nocardioides sp.]
MSTGMAAYRRLLANRTVRSVLLLGFAIRIPIWASFIVLTLHVVSGLDRGYAAAGLVTTVATVAMAVAGPWRGRALDRIGLRATIAPQLVVLAVVWSIAPFVSYAGLLVLAVVGGLANLPHFSVIRQVLIAAVNDDDRKAALSLDALFTELSFMVGPVIGVLIATWFDTSWALLGCQLAGVVGGVALWWVNPALVPAAPEPEVSEESLESALVPTGRPVPASALAAGLWRSPAILAVLAAGVATTVVLTGTDLGVVAALREMDEPGSIGWLLAIWGAGSAVGALVYGALHRPVPLNLLLALLAATTIPVALADDRLTLGLLLFACGLFCAPTITAASEALSRAVPVTNLGEVMGWQGVAFTVGSSTGAPLAGLAIDHSGWPAAFVATGGVALVAAVIALGLEAGRARQRAGAARTLEA